MLLPSLLVLAQEETPAPSEVEVGENASEEVGSILESLAEALPRLAIAVVVLLLFVGVAMLLRRILRNRLQKSHSDSYANVFSRLLYGLVVSFGTLIAVTILIPSVTVGSLVAGLGVFSIAIGFAFQDILSNLLAGILLLLRQPFEEGDTIEVQGQAGVVQAITIRETQIKTFDGQKIVIPNADVYQGVIRVQTAYGPKRTDIAIGLEDWADFDAATDVILGALDGLDGVLAEPAPQAFFTHFADSTTNLDVRYWTESQQGSVRGTQDRAVRSIGKALKEAGIPMPSPIRELDARESMDRAMLRPAALAQRDA